MATPPRYGTLCLSFFYIYRFLLLLEKFVRIEKFLLKFNHVQYYRLKTHISKRNPLFNFSLNSLIPFPRSSYITDGRNKEFKQIQGNRRVTTKKNHNHDIAQCTGKITRRGLLYRDGSILERQGSRTHARGTAFENWRHPDTSRDTRPLPCKPIQSHFTRKRRARSSLGKDSWKTLDTLFGWRQLAGAALAPRRFSTLDPTAPTTFSASNISTNTRSPVERNSST